LAKLFYQVMARMGLKNAPSTSSGGSNSKGSSSGIGSFTRDPKTTQVRRIGYQLSSSRGGGRDEFEESKVDLSLIATAIEKDSYLMQAVMRYRELIFKSGYAFVGKNEQSLEYIRMRLEMMAIATQTPTEELFKGIADDVVRYANCFLVKARGKSGQGLAPGVVANPMPPAKYPVVGYFRLPPQTMSIQRDANGNITKYRQEVEGGGDALEFRPEDIVHITVNRPVGEAFGIPWISPVIEDVRLLRKVEENAALLLYRHIFPLLAYTVGIAEPGYESTDEEIANLQSVIEDMPTDGAIVLPERHKIQAVNIQTMDVRPLMDYFENRVFTGMGMSQVDMGRGDTANRNTADAMSGMKADRVKGWQQQIQVQIDKFMIEEILVEGGFDPMVNPDFDVNFIFNEIEQEMRIKQETHEIYKFEHNLQTWEETRKAMGMDPVVDESRLSYQMIGASKTGSSAETDNKQQPTNQHGTRSGPKRSTEYVNAEEYFMDKFPATGYFRYKGPLVKKATRSPEPVQESVSARYPKDKIDELRASVDAIYTGIEEDILGEIRRLKERKAFPITDIKSTLSSIYFGKEKMLQQVLKASNDAILTGAKEAMKDAGRSRLVAVNTSAARQMIADSATQSFDYTEKLISDILSEKLDGLDNPSEAMLRVRGVFQSLKHRNSVICRSMIAKAFNYGYVLAMIRYGESEVYTDYDGACPTCLEKSQEPIKLSRLSSMDEMTIYEHIPPWHPNCDCSLVLGKGGESK